MSIPAFHSRPSVRTFCHRCRSALSGRLVLPALVPLATCLLACACLLQFSGRLPPLDGLSGWLLAGSLLYLSRRARPLGLCLLLLAMLAVSVHAALQARLPASLSGQTLTLTGTVASLPRRQDFNDRMVVSVQDCEPGCGMLRQVLLSWSAAPGGSLDEEEAASGQAGDAVWPQPGQRWRLRVRLKPPLAAVNPSAFDSEQRMLQQGIDAVGRVLTRERLPDDDGPGATLAARVEALRSHLRARIEALLIRIEGGRGPEASRWSLLGIVTGLSLGDQAAIGAGQWALFSRTGVSHLMAISGMHVTLLAMLVVALCQRLHRGLARRMPGRGPAWLAACPRPWLVLGPGLLSAFGYAALSGWGVPAQRTCFMLLAAAVLRLRGRCDDALSPVLLAAGIIVALDPWAVAQAGFWLSFCAVLALIWCAQQPLPESRLATGRMAGLWRGLREAVRNQWAATVLLTPLTIAFFSTWSLVGPLANALAIPWVGFVLTPMAIAVMLLAPCWPWLAGWLLRALLWQLDGLMQVLHWLDGLPLASLVLPTPTLAGLLAALLGAVLLLAPAGLRRPRLGLLCLLPMLLAPPRQAPDDALVVTALDIGQGSMVLVEQGDARLLYDTGPARQGGRSSVEGVLLPWLQGRGLDEVGWLVLSHLDAGHVGGAEAAWRRLRPGRVMAPFAPALAGIHDLRPDRADAAGLAGAAEEGAGATFVPCLAGRRLPWGPGIIEVLSPQAVVRDRQHARDDRHSCVLRIRTPAGSVLLAGDLPARAEAGLLARTGHQGWQADLLVVPGQGSRHGAGDELLATVQPGWAIVQNRHGDPNGHPHPQLRQRLARHGVSLLRTDWHGAVRIELRAGRAAVIHRSRVDDAPYWRVRVADEETSEAAARSR